MENLTQTVNNLKSASLRLTGAIHLASKSKSLSKSAILAEANIWLNEIGLVLVKKPKGAKEKATKSKKREGSV
jgi:hypothetical protein